MCFKSRHSFPLHRCSRVIVESRWVHVHHDRLSQSLRDQVRKKRVIRVIACRWFGLSPHDFFLAPFGTVSNVSFLIVDCFLSFCICNFSFFVSSFSFNMWQIVHYIDIDILYTNTVSSLPLSSLFLGFSSSACPQTDTAQLYNTHPDSCTHMDRTGLEFHFVFAKTRTVHTVILTTFRLTHIYLYI